MSITTKGVSLPPTLWAEVDQYAQEVAQPGERPNRSRAIGRLLRWALRENRNEAGGWDDDGEGVGDE